jgi:hypothetical protein
MKPLHNIFSSMNHPRALSCLAAAILLPLAAARAVEVRFLNVDGPEYALKFTNAGKSVGITADDNAFSAAYPFSGKGPLVLFKETTVDKKTARVTAATIELPRELTHALVVLTAVDKSLATYSGTVIDDSPVTRPAGTILLLNSSRHPLSFKLDAEEFTLAPKGVRQMPFSQDINRIVVQADALVDGNWTRVFGNPLPVRSGVRVLLLLRDGRAQPGSNPNIVDMLSFYDHPAALPDTGTKPAP